MRYFVIADNTDTLVGLRLAGMEGVEVHDRAGAAAAIASVRADPDIGVLLISESLADLCADELTPLRLSAHTPLVTELPGRHSKGRAGDSITTYIREAIGVKI